MADNESVQSAMDKSDTPAHSVDYYYLEAMRYLTCKAAHHSDDSEDEDHECSCSRCRAEQSKDADGTGPGGLDTSDGSNMDGANQASGSRERSWSHSMAKDRESGTISELPKLAGNRLKNRRFSDGMLLKQTMKVSNGHVQWADDCKKELTRFRPRKKYTRSPCVTQLPVKSILKNCSHESLVIQEDLDSSTSSVDD
ncbi:hypothetical protein PoB_006912800 [Plakobranchus ocellatus]|uniref:Uncharacterized protein n=1 Tax=Plakobranchus ocellatus TaxID=259542 RepID=A0AAV4DEY2_9GAST|nr:hypothetical protein PoB_006912800 [Plakobranchus ocellatus]